jgi:hypothetical protein
VGGIMESFKLSDKSSHYEVKLDKEKGILSIGCKNYHLEHITEVFEALVHKGHSHHRGLSSDGAYVLHETFRISLEDAKRILEVLKYE